jgi:hypothetical protein
MRNVKCLEAGLNTHAARAGCLPVKTLDGMWIELLMFFLPMLLSGQVPLPVALCPLPHCPTANGHPAARVPASVPAARPPVISVAAHLSAVSLMGHGKVRHRAQGAVSPCVACRIVGCAQAPTHDYVVYCMHHRLAAWHTAVVGSTFSDLLLIGLIINVPGTAGVAEQGFAPQDLRSSITNIIHNQCACQSW